MNLDRFEIWHNVPRESMIQDGAFQLVNSQLILYDIETKKPFKFATRCVIELSPSGLPTVVGLEVLDVDENGRVRREDGKGKVIRYGTLDVDQVHVAAVNLVEQIEKRATAAALVALQRLGGGEEPRDVHTGPVGYSTTATPDGFRMRADGEQVLTLAASAGSIETPDGEDL